MSIDINWEAATSGPDGDALAERIRSFIHDKFQQIALPRFIRSVEATAFDFGTVSPELEIRDICDPFSDFYEEDEDEENLSDGSDEPLSQASQTGSQTSGRDTWHEDGSSTIDARLLDEMQSRRMSAHSQGESTIFPPLRSPMMGDPLNPYFFPRSGTPGIPGGMSNLGYYYMPLSGLSGTQTPLTSVTRSPFSEGRGDNNRDSPHFASRQSEAEVDSAQSRPSTSDTVPSTQSLSDQDRHNHSRATQTNGQSVQEQVDASTSIPPQADDLPRHRMRERKPDDLQVFCRVRYAGNIKISLTAQILLDYPMPSFVGLPLKLNITGVTFNGVAVVAYMRRRVHFCFLSPEDAHALLGPDETMNNAEEPQPRPSSSGSYSGKRRIDSLLRDIRVESEIGRKENGKQVLKNVGKVEKFVLEQVRRIFEEEFVYPSFWTFLV